MLRSTSLVVKLVRSWKWSKQCPEASTTAGFQWGVDKQSHIPRSRVQQCRFSGSTTKSCSKVFGSGCIGGVVILGSRMDLTRVSDCTLAPASVPASSTLQRGLGGRTSGGLRPSLQISVARHAQTVPQHTIAMYTCAVCVPHSSSFVDLAETPVTVLLCCITTHYETAPASYEWGRSKAQITSDSANLVPQRPLNTGVPNQIPTSVHDGHARSRAPIAMSQHGPSPHVSPSARLHKVKPYDHLRCYKDSSLQLSSTMPAIPQRFQTEGSSTFSPDDFFTHWADESLTPPYDNDFRKFIIRAFGLTPRDDYGYAAVSEVTLLQAQTYVEWGAQGGMHGWYREESPDDGKKLKDPPPASDVAAYTDIFRSTTSTAKALTALLANAKKESIRRAVADHLLALYDPPAPDRKLIVNKTKAHVNPYLDVWAWSNQNLEWCGPDAATKETKISHAILPVLYHHFSCLCPSYEILSLIQQVSHGRRVVDMGSGNGYWTYMLRRLPPISKALGSVTVLPIDNGVSEWRTMWIPDTLETDGAAWLEKNAGAKHDVLLLVYPTVGQEFTSRMIRAYQGSTLVCCGTQNANGFTGFKGETIAEWMLREMGGQWEKVCQIPLPSFAGKDEAGFIFERKIVG
nr:hypothetical protein CFP56_16702 [Quercus suber]